jgi:hypothetical protein
VFLADKLSKIDEKGEDWRRVRRSIDALTKGSTEHDLQDERFHQTVRSLEGLILPKAGSTRKQFVHRSHTFSTGSAIAETLGEIFDVRSKVEHLHMALEALPGSSNEAKEELLYRRARQTDQLAWFAISRILENDDLREAFRTVDGIAAFWNRKDADRAMVWGSRLDLDLIA